MSFFLLYPRQVKPKRKLILLPETTLVEQLRTPFVCNVQIVSDMGQQNSSRRGVQASQDMNHKSPLLLPTEAVAIEQVSTSQLKMLALHAGEHSVGIRDRSFLLASIERTNRTEAGTSWLVQNAKVYCACSTPATSYGTLQYHDHQPAA